MEYILDSIASYLETKKDALTERLIDDACRKLDTDLTTDYLTKHREMLPVLISKVAKSLTRSQEETEEMNITYELDTSFFRDGTFLRDTIDLISTFRLSLMNELKDDGLFDRMTVSEITELYEEVIFVFDDVIRNTTRRFNINNQERLDTMEAEVVELSAPVVPIKRGTAILPMVGEFNEKRAKHIMENVIPKIIDSEIETLVIDLSGILEFDTYVAQNFFSIRDVLQLVGVEMVVTGIRPSVAQTSVQLGINFKNLNAHGTLAEYLSRTS
ncbi:STAS domain-containing protein [Alteribacter natronophilus]|uniref:STAS domain-containing protein n=1 Tax=Alteribacter natronophilus TaxID=2583810 RepID=UPI001485DA2C|nr:STAS domain-containing protein [Alteribacter natronophilus]